MLSILTILIISGSIYWYFSSDTPKKPQIHEPKINGKICPEHSTNTNNVCVCDKPEQHIVMGKCVNRCLDDQLWDQDEQKCICVDTSKKIFEQKCINKCHETQSWDSENELCVCTDVSKTLGDDGLCVDKCKSNQTWDIELNNCICNEADKKVDENGNCINRCLENQSWDNTNKICTCDDPAYHLINNQCVSRCLTGQTWNTTNNVCECDDEQKELNADGFCVYRCPVGQRWNGEGCECVEPSKHIVNGVCVDKCPLSDQSWDNENKTCICNDPSKHIVNGICVNKCPENQIWDNEQQKCVCPDAEVLIEEKLDGSDAESPKFTSKGTIQYPRSIGASLRYDGGENYIKYNWNNINLDRSFLFKIKQRSESWIGWKIILNFGELIKLQFGRGSGSTDNPAYVKLFNNEVEILEPIVKTEFTSNNNEHLWEVEYISNSKTMKVFYDDTLVYHNTLSEKLTGNAINFTFSGSGGYVGYINIGHMLLLNGGRCNEPEVQVEGFSNTEQNNQNNQNNKTLFELLYHSELFSQIL